MMSHLHFHAETIFAPETISIDIPPRKARLPNSDKSPKGMRLHVFVVDIVVAMLAGAMYCMARSSARQSKNGLCELVCAESPNIVRVVPCFVLPIAGCSGEELP